MAMKPTLGSRKPYMGTTRSIVLALDVGTTFSGVSYAILEPGEVPKIHGVTRFPGQEHVAGNSKIPSIMYYDKNGEMMAAGAEADGASVLAQAEDDGWVKTELFKLRLRPRTMDLKMNGMRLSPLPRGKSAVQVFGDFLQYLFRCTRSFIIDTHANGQVMWQAVGHNIQLVLSHPNGWEGAQQTKMRAAAVYGGLIPDTDEGKARIRFVTEGEASLHACVLNGLTADVLSNSSASGHGFIVADAGGGTLDISTYAIRGAAPLVIEEIAPPDCVFAGSVFVSRRARAFFEEKLKNSKYGSPDALDHITKRFDESTKRLFRDNKGLEFVPFGSPYDKDPSVGIRAGQLKLTGMEVAALFEPSVQSAVGSIKAQIAASSAPVQYVWLVGGFAASPWLFSQLQEHLGPLGVIVSRPDTQTSKAVADGAVGFYCDHHVSARVSKFMYGVEYLREYDASDEEHVARKHKLFELPSGPRLLPDAFDCILARGVRVKESSVFSRKYCTEVTNLTTLSVFEVEIWCFRGGDTVPNWILRNTEHFSTLCYVRADLSPLAGSARPMQGKNGKMYWTIVFSIEIHFGLTEFRARIKWTDNGETKYGPASIVYNEKGHRVEEDEPEGLPDDELDSYPRASSDRHKSYASSRAPSRDPMTPTSRNAPPSVPPSVPPSAPPSAHPSHPPQVDFPPYRSAASTRRPSIDNSRIYEHERKVSITSRSERSEEWREHREVSRAASSVDKGKQRDRSIPQEPSHRPDRLSERDRAVNLSTKSTDSQMSVRTNATAKLSKQLDAVWGPPSASSVPSKQASPSASPRVDTMEFETVTPRERKPIYASVPPTPRDSKPPTPQLEPAKPPAAISTSSRAIPPSLASGAETPVATPKVATPAYASKFATPANVSKVATPANVSKVATPANTSKMATPTVVSKVATPQAMSKAATPAATPKPTSTGWGASVAPSKVPTPAASIAPSKAATPAVSKAPSKVASKTPTPLAMSKVATPRSLSKANTPIAENSDPWGASLDTPTPQPPSPKFEPVVPPAVEEPPPFLPEPPTPAPPSPKVATPRAPSPTIPEEPVSDPIPQVVLAPAVEETQNIKEGTNVNPEEVPGAFFDSTDQAGATNGLDSGWDVVGDNKKDDFDSWGLAGAKPVVNAKAAMNDLWDQDKQSDAGGGFSNFLSTGSQWGTPPAVSKNNSDAAEKAREKGPSPAPSLTNIGFGQSNGGSGGGFGWGAGSLKKGFGASLGGWGASAKKSTTSLLGSLTDSLSLSGPTEPSPPVIAEPAITDIPLNQVNSSSPQPSIFDSKPTPKGSPTPPAAAAPRAGAAWGTGKGKSLASGAISQTPSLSSSIAPTPAAEIKKPTWGSTTSKAKSPWGTPAISQAPSQSAPPPVPEEPVVEAAPAQPPAPPDPEPTEPLKLDTTATTLEAQKDDENPPPTTSVDKATEDPDAWSGLPMTASQKKKLKLQQAKKEKEEKARQEQEEQERMQKEEEEKARQEEEQMRKQEEELAQQTQDWGGDAGADAWGASTEVQETTQLPPDTTDENKGPTPEENQTQQVEEPAPVEVKKDDPPPEDQNEDGDGDKPALGRGAGNAGGAKKKKKGKR